MALFREDCSSPLIEGPRSVLCLSAPVCPPVNRWQHSGRRADRKEKDRHSTRVWTAGDKLETVACLVKVWAKYSCGAEKERGVESPVRQL